MKKDAGFTWKLGMFVIIGLVLFVGTIYLIGRQRNLFGSTFKLTTQFKTVGGLKLGNNVRFSGINIGTISGIDLVTDSAVLVEMVLNNDVRKFIKTDATAGIGSDGLMGDKILTISPGTKSAIAVKDNGRIISTNAIEMEDVMRSVKASVDNAGIITAQLAQFSYKMNNGNGTLTKLITDEEFSNSLKSTLSNLQMSSKEFARFTVKMNNGKGALSKLMSDEKFGKTLDSTMQNLQSGTKSLSENMEAAKSNILLRGYFNKKKRAALKKQQELQKKTNTKLKTDSLKNSSAKDSIIK